MIRNVLSAIIIASTALAVPSCKQFMPGKNTDGKVKFIVGEVTLNGKKTILGDTVRFGDTIETGKDSTCEIIIADKNLMMLAPETRLLYRVTTRESNLELSRGAFGAIIRNRDATGDIIIKMPTVTASIRGTIFYIAVEGRDRTYACTCNGRMRYHPDRETLSKPAAGESEEKIVAACHHEAYYYSREKGAIKIEKAGLKYHGDEAMNKAAAAIGETIDWTKIE
ncbi:MAG TPA: FecR family protein [Spirochaetota bacterium]|nr:FecR family protein [Spirochaetota bacterium]HPC42639.1 FecR family protein [Spirochaetota bacterium]HPL16266.1 FecR family protein [Spirochaetota bacterium]HQF08441.1 FecR family protein [Spirochaetota bacterium]HQH99079.1 FecR family protein [Spirochaetota bacterium]